MGTSCSSGIIKEVQSIRTREMGYDDYGLGPGEDKRLKKYCTSPDFDDHMLLLNSALGANKYLASDLYYSIAKGLSYEDMDRTCYIPISKGDFYGYQRKTLYIFRDMLRLYGKWE